MIAGLLAIHTEKRKARKYGQIPSNAVQSFDVHVACSDDRPQVQCHKSRSALSSG